MASAVDSRLAYARLSAVATASRLPTATRDSNNSYTTTRPGRRISRFDVAESAPMRKIVRWPFSKSVREARMMECNVIGERDFSGSGERGGPGQPTLLGRRRRGSITSPLGGCTARPWRSARGPGARRSPIVRPMPVIYPKLSSRAANERVKIMRSRCAAPGTAA